MSNKDRNIAWERTREFIPVTAFSGYTLAEGTPNIISSADDGAPGIAETNSLGITGLNQDAAGDSVSHMMLVPRKWDLTEAIKIAVVWSCSNTDAGGTVTWLVTYKSIAEGDALAAAATALDTVIGADTDDTTAYGLNVTSFGVINANTLTRDTFITINVEMDAVDASVIVAGTDTIVLHGIIIEYKTKLCVDQI